MRFQNWRRGITAALVLACSTAVHAVIFNVNGSGDGANGGYSPILSATAWTYVNADGFSSNKARVEVWLDGISGSKTCPMGSLAGGACVSESTMGIGSPQVNGQQDVNRGNGVYSFGCYNSKANHWGITSGGTWYPRTSGGNPSTTSFCVPLPPKHEPVQCPADGPYWCGSSPILVPTGNSMAVQVSAPEVAFDINAEGVLRTVAWPVDGDALAFLAYDRDGNGTIDNGSELLGNHFFPNDANGFDALEKLLTDAGYPVSGAIEESNPVFAHLLLWNDRNRNGVSEPSELRPASDVLHRIGLGYFTSDRTDPNGSAYLFKGWAEFKGNNGQYQNKPVYDVTLATQ